MTSTPEPVNPEFAAFREEFLDHLFPDGLPENQKDLWRELR